MGELSKLPNIGEDTEKQLNMVGIHSYDELKAIGAEQAWLKLQELDESACINRLLGLEGALQGINKTLIKEERRAELKAFYQWHKK